MDSGPGLSFVVVVCRLSTLSNDISSEGTGLIGLNSVASLGCGD